AEDGIRDRNVTGVQTCALPILHTLAIANEAEIDYDLERVNKIAERVPYLAKIMPASDISMDDVCKAGGVQAIINELASIPGAIHPDRPTIAGVTMRELVKDYKITDDQDRKSTRLNSSHV